MKEYPANRYNVSVGDSVIAHRLRTTQLIRSLAAEPVAQIILSLSNVHQARCLELQSF